LGFGVWGLGFGVWGLGFGGNRNAAHRARDVLRLDERLAGRGLDPLHNLRTKSKRERYVYVRVCPRDQRHVYVRVCPRDQRRRRTGQRARRAAAPRSRAHSDDPPPRRRCRRAAARAGGAQRQHGSRRSNDWRRTFGLLVTSGVATKDGQTACTRTALRRVRAPVRARLGTGLGPPWVWHHLLSDRNSPTERTYWLTPALVAAYTGAIGMGRYEDMEATFTTWAQLTRF
jgi:hypothetical protein